MMKKVKILLVWTNPFSANRGVGALTYSLLYLLEKIALEFHVSFEYYIVGNSQVYGKTVVDILGKKIDIHILRFINPFKLKGVIKTILYIDEFVKQIKADYVLDIGEGDSFSDIYGLFRFNEINSSKKLFNILGKKQMLLPQTIGPFKYLHSQKKALNSICKVAMVTVRDKQSYNLVKAYSPNITVKELIDVAFFLPYEPAKFDDSKIHIGVNVSSLIWNGGYTKNNQFGLKAEYKKLVSSILSYFMNVDDVVVHLVAHVMHTNSDIENDYEVCREIEQENNNTRIVTAPFFLDPIEAKSYISGLHFFIGTRMHACIAAYSSGVVTYPIAYSIKFNGLFCDTLNYRYLGDLVKSSNDEILNGMTETFKNREAIRKEIAMVLKTDIYDRKQQLESSLKTFLDL